MAVVADDDARLDNRPSANETAASYGSVRSYYSRRVHHGCPPIIGNGQRPDTREPGPSLTRLHDRADEFGLSSAFPPLLKPSKYRISRQDGSGAHCIVQIAKQL